jgi:hypothetical protein
MPHTVLDRPAFVVGVAGHMDPHESAFANNSEHDVREKIRLLFRFLKKGADGELLELVKKCLPDSEQAEGLGGWPGLRHTPIVVLTALAPGADSLVAQLALEQAQKDMGIFVQAPLPFRKDLYRKASIFVKDPAAPTHSEQKNQQDFDDLIKRIGEENSYPVRLADELDVDEDALFHQMVKDLEIPRKRRCRYQATGEYIAAHCDMLLALWDDDYLLAGHQSTRSVVEAKLRGIIPDLLPAANSFSWADCGSVVHIYMPRRKNANGPNERKLGKMSWLHPAALPKEREISAIQTEDHLLCRLARNLDGFNREYQVPDDCSQTLYQVLDAGSQASTNQAPFSETIVPALQEQAPQFFNALAPLAAARRYAADTSRTRLRPESKLVLLMIFLLAFVSAACLDAFSNLPQKEASDNATAKKEPASSMFWGLTRYAQFEFGLGGLLSGVLGLGVFWWHRPCRTEERDHDYRALAEGLRVQFAWCLAGLNRSAAAHYMERERNELEWIRSALSSLSMPHQRWTEWFAHLNPELQLKLLNWTLDHWVNEQFKYHKRRAEEHKQNLDLFHKIGSVLALAGFLQLLVLVANSFHPIMDKDSLASDISNFFRSALKVDIFAGLVLLALFLLALFLFLWVHKSLQVGTKQMPWSTALSMTLRPTCWAFVKKAVPTLQSSAHHSKGRRRRRMFLSFFGYAPMALVAVIFALGSIECAKRPVGVLHAQLPDAHVLVMISSGIFLLAGALAVAWAEKNLWSEQAYQFNDMASLFHAGYVRLKERLCAAEKAEDTENRADRIKQAQYILYDLGTEALGENAEWLILHRARPMEPMVSS